MEQHISVDGNKVAPPEHAGVQEVVVGQPGELLPALQPQQGRPSARRFKAIAPGTSSVASPNALPTFSIEERFARLSQAVEMVAQNISPSLIVFGPGGVGKTYEVNRTLRALGLIEDADYFHIKGYSSARGLYETLYENNGRLTVFDDCDNALTDSVAEQLLKGALDSYDKRTISWVSAAAKADGRIPLHFDFHGQVIFISNRDRESIDPAIRTRSFVIDLSMTKEEILQRMQTLLPHIETDASSEQRRMAMDFIREWAHHIKQLNLRTLVQVLRTIKAHPTDWPRLAILALSQC